ncbi:hypothetical protein T265_03557 [Opisthorchis viverrini]|uniref:Uncharacterized protein n=1 Tax=Opisthorchis viverrini TaxID=6198 RepID=A0A075A2Q8_OPIVI|nr:hypothetical protein T265_03557 [Opisthorchis viverrini]KER29855.1 hypothetical protein T265_03557 [Opisthorchis viverrini]
MAGTSSSCSINDASVPKVRPASSVSLLAERLKLSSLNESNSETIQQKTELLAVEQTTLHIRRMSNQHRPVIYQGDVGVEHTSMEQTPNQLFPSSLFIDSGSGSSQLYSEHEDEEGEAHWTANQGQMDEPNSMEHPTDITSKAHSVAATHPDASFCTRAAESYVSASHPPAKRACRSSSATCDLNQMPHGPHSQTCKCPASEGQMNALLRPVAIRLTPMSRQSTHLDASNTNCVRANGVTVVLRTRHRDSNRASRLSWHHPLFCSETDAKAQHPSYGVQVGCNFHACGASPCSSNQRSGSNSQLDRLAAVTGRYLGSAEKSCLTEPRNQFRGTGSVNSFSESDCSNSSGVESLHCSHPSAFTPTSARFESPRNATQSFTYSLSPEMNSVSSSVPISVPTPSSGFQEAVFSCFSDACSSLPDCSLVGFRSDADPRLSNQQHSGSEALSSLQFACSGPSGPSGPGMSDYATLQFRLNTKDDTIRCRSQPTAVQPESANLVPRLPFTTAECSREAENHWIAGLKRRRGLSGETDTSNTNTLVNNSCRCQSEAENSVSEHGEMHRSMEFQYATLNHSPTSMRRPISFPESPSLTLPNGIFIFGSMASRPLEEPCFGADQSKSILPSDTLHCTDHTPSSSCLRCRRVCCDNSVTSDETIYQSQMGGCACSLMRSTLGHENFPSRHGYPHLGDLSESMEEEKEYETPEAVTEEASGLYVSSGNRSKYPTNVSPSLSDIGFEPIRAMSADDTNTEVCDNSSIRHSGCEQGADATSKDAFFDQPKESIPLNPDEIISLSSTDSDSSDGGTPLTHSLITRRRRLEKQHNSFCSPQSDHTAVIPLAEIDLELMENN